MGSGRALKAPQRGPRRGAGQKRILACFKHHKTFLFIPINYADALSLLNSVSCHIWGKVWGNCPCPNVNPCTSSRCLFPLIDTVVTCLIYISIINFLTGPFIIIIIIIIIIAKTSKVPLTGAQRRRTVHAYT